jgi:hypothetical protein
MDEIDELFFELMVMVEENQHALIPAYAVLDRLTEILIKRPDGIPFDGDEFTKIIKKKQEEDKD